MKRIFLLCLIISAVVFSNDASAQWSKHIDFPQGGYITDMASDNNGNIYVLVGREIYLTTNNGTSWTLVPNTLGHWLIYDIDVNKANGRLYAASLSGIHWTTNQGQQWQLQTFTGGGQSGPTSVGFYKIAVKQGTNIVVAASDQETAVTLNGGSAWSLNQSFISQYPWEMKFLANGDVLIGSDNGIYKSVNNGVNWLAMNNGLQDMRVVSIVQNPANNYLYAAVNYNNSTNDTTAAGIYLSIDNGVSWTLSSNGIINRKATAVIVNPNGDVFAGTADGIYRSSDNATSWKPLNAGLQDSSITCITTTGAGMFLGTSYAGVANKTGAANWTHMNNGLNTYGFDDMLVMPNSDIYLKGSGGFYISPGATTPWQGPLMFPNVQGRILCKDNTGNFYMTTYNYVAGTGQTVGLYKSVNNGASWTDITANLPIPPGTFSYVFRDMEVAANGEIYVLAELTPLVSAPKKWHVYASSNGGATFTAPLQTPGAGFATISDINVGPNGDLYLVGQDNPSFPSTVIVGHATAQATNVNILPTTGFKLFLSAKVYVDRNNVPYVARYDSLYKYSSSGNWTLLPTAGIVGSDMKIYFDNDNDIYAVSRSAIHKSADGGNAWTDISAGVPVFTGVFGVTMLSLDNLQFDSNDDVYAYSTDVETAAVPYRGIYKFSGIVPASVDNVAKAGTALTVYPNPASEKLTIAFNNMQLPGGVVSIYDHTGKMVQRLDVSKNQGNLVEVSIGAMAPGLYFVEWISKDGKAVQKFIKQ